MKEDLLHYLWQYQEFDKEQLSTSRNERIQIISVGVHNHHAGPDFHQARIQLDGMLWSGAVEIHIRSSDWYRHRHDKDHAYDNVVLHVVWEDDAPARRSDGTYIPTLALKNRVPMDFIYRYQQFFQANYQQDKEVLCKSQLPFLDPLTILSAMENALVQRIERKSGEILQLLESNRGDWNVTIYQSLVRGFGFKINTDVFTMLGKAVPLSVLKRLGNRMETFEAVFFGQAGFLDMPFQQAYPSRLKEEYQFLSSKFHLQKQKLKAGLWKFARLRPANFPTLRIAQLAMFTYQHVHDLVSLLKETEVKNMIEHLSVCQSSYWQEHYHLERESSIKIPGLGKESIYNLIINVVVPLKFAYARYFHDEPLAESALALLQNIPAEKNKITRQYKPLNFPLASAFDSQAVIELHHHYCTLHKCLDCKIGMSIMKNREISLS